MTMYQFGRILTLSGDPRQTMAWAAEVTGMVNTITDLNVSLWGSRFGYPVGTVAWSAIVEGRAHQASEAAKLAANNEYLDFVAKAQDWVSAPAEDIFRRIVHGGPGDNPPEVGAIASITQAVAATGKLAEAVAWAIDMATHATSVTGNQVNLLLNAYTDFGGIAFISTVPDMAAADAAADALEADTGYIDKIGGSAGLFVEGSAHQSLLQRLA
jgi:hypothetical protein